MKKTSRILALVLTLILTLALTVILPGCTPSDVPEQGSGSSDVTSSPSETDPIAEGPTEYTLLSGGKGYFKIIRPATLGNEDTSVKTAVELRKLIMNSTNVSLDLGDDWVKDGASHDSSAYEILIGYTNYPETAEVMNSIGYGEYAIKAVGNKIVVFSYTNIGYTRALSKLQSIIRANTVKAEDGSSAITISSEALDVVETAEKMTSTLPLFEGGTFSSVANMGDGCYGVIISDTTTEAYNAYLGRLAEDGYNTYTTNEIAGSYFATLYTEDYTINAGFYNNIDEVRVIIEPYEDDTLPPLKSDAAPITTSQLTMIGVEGIYNGDYQQNGLCLVYRLSDGRFVIVDGGHSGNSGIYAANIIDALREQSKDYAKTDKDITIAAWIITHPHTDHQGTFVKEYKQFTKFTIESIMCNFWSEEDFNKSKNTTASFAESTFNGYNKPVQIAKELGVDYVVPHVGQVFWFGDTAFEFLYTIESFLPQVATGFNTCSLVFRTITADNAGNTTTAIVTGDATAQAFAICKKMYGTELQCDIMQVAHHGGGTGGSNGDTQSAYSLMKPAVVLWPIGVNNYPSVYKNTYNHALLEGQNPNFAELYIAGWQGNSVTLPLPYSVGNAIIHEVLEPKSN